MKMKIMAALLVISIMAGLPVAIAKPERLMLKDSVKKSKERVAAAQIKNMDLRDIEDPAARKAIQEILNYLSLQAKK